ncbi:MAG: AzlC family ABC transporter permease [Methyloligellaceae bacterium]
MTNGAPTAPPAWTVGATTSKAFRRGILEAPSTPAIVLVATMTGFGALAHAVGFSFLQVIFVTITMFALPAQVVMADQIAAGASLLGVSLAVMITAIRLMPMTIVLVPLLKTNKTPLWVLLLLSHVVAVTAWIEALRRLPKLPLELRIPYFAGFSLMLVGFSVLGAGIGYSMAREVPVEIAAGLIFLTPLYFVISLIEIAKPVGDGKAVLFGMILGPLLFVYIPGFDLLTTGLIGGTLAYWLRKRSEP